MSSPRAALPQAHAVITAGRYYDVTSRTNGRAYRIFVGIPWGPPPPSGYPVVYLLDGNWYFNIAGDTARLQAATGELPKAVIVGIGYPVPDGTSIVPLRSFDLSLPVGADALPQIRLGPDNAGGADSFLRFLKEEARPLVEQVAPVDRRCQTLFGHSLGGLVVLRSLFTDPGSFQSYVAASPAIWWGNDAVLADEPQFVARVKSGRVAARLLLTVGGLEQTPSKAMIARNPNILANMRRTAMVDRMHRLAKRLSAVRSANFQVTSETLAGERHNSAVPAVINRALHFGLPCPGWRP